MNDNHELKQKLKRNDQILSVLMNKFNEINSP